MEILGYSAAILIGVSLGLIGGGGSILTVPVLVYLFDIHPSQATFYSLFIVGITSLAGAYSNYKKQQVSISTTLLFGISSIITVLLTRRLIVPAIPEYILSIGNWQLTKSFATMLLFALLMIAAAISMIRTKDSQEQAGTCSNGKTAYGKLLLYGLLIGLVTGLLGAGGGFLLIPALVLLVKLPVKTAIGTSLAIIALNSLIGFTGDPGHYSIDWTLLIILSTLAIAGIIAGSYLGKKIDSSRLKQGFGWFVLAMGIVVITIELMK
ncbi:MAG: sulfite exporter TauE/SafE family protein [Chitinophagaceae bacterium]